MNYRGALKEFKFHGKGVKMFSNSHSVIKDVVEDGEWRNGKVVLSRMRTESQSTRLLRGQFQNQLAMSMIKTKSKILNDPSIVGKVAAGYHLRHRSGSFLKGGSKALCRVT